jgi:DinB superfamily
MNTTSPSPTATTSCCGGAPAVPPVEFFMNLPTKDLIARYRKGVENYDRRVFWLNESEIDTAFLPDAGVGRWPIRVLLGHLADAEVSFVHRLRKTAAEEQPVLQAWDEDAFIDANLYGHIKNVNALANGGVSLSPEASKARVAAVLGGFVAVVHTLRQWTGAWLETLPEAAFTREAMHTQRGAQTLKQILAYATWHVEHHSRFLKLKVDKLTGKAPLSGRTGENGQGGSCGPGCACAGGPAGAPMA